MQMRIKFFLIFLLFSKFLLAEDSIIEAALQKYTQNHSSSIYQEDATRAFDLSTGNTSASVITTLITSTNIGTLITSHDWHPSGKWLAAVGRGVPNGAIFDFSSQGTALYHINPNNTITHGANLESVRWHPSGNYLAYVGAIAGGIEGKVLKFNQTTGVKSNLTSAANIVHGANLEHCSWSPDGIYLTVVGFGPTNIDHIRTYSFVDEKLWELSQGKITYNPSPTNEIECTDWHPSGNYLAICGDDEAVGAVTVQVFYFDKYQKTFTKLIGCNAEYGDTAYFCRWSPNGQYLAVGGDQVDPGNTITLRVYEFNGKALTLKASTHNGPIDSTDVYFTEVVWSTDGSYLASIAGADQAFNGDNSLRIYYFSGSSLDEITTAAYDHGQGLRTLAWSADQAYIAVSGWSGTGAFKTRVLRFIEPVDLILKKQKKEIVLLKKMFLDTSNRLPTLYDTVINTSNLLQSTVASNLRRTLLVESSNASLSLGGVDPNATLVVNNSYALISLNTLNVANSNTLVTMEELNVSTSNALSGLLIRTSQAVNALLIPNSQAIVTINTLASANSAAIITTNNLVIQNSNTIVTYQPLIIANSQAISGLLVATSNGTAGLLVATSEAASATAIKAARLDTIDTGPANIHFNSPTITMSYNLLLSTDHQLFVHASGVVNGNGHSITFARGAGTQLTVDPSVTTTFQNVIFKDYNDQATSLGAGSSLIFGNNCRVEISEPQTLLRTWSFAGISQLNGLGNALTLGTGPRFLSTLISSSLQLSNLKLLNVRENNVRAAHNNAAILYQDVVLNMSADFTYSIGSMLIQNDVTIRGTSTFNYTTIMGCTVSPASQLTIDPGVSFNYAPAGNFRNLLSLTDSSARLYFNSATLVATSTGPRLTKGTLLVDGIMNIQSGAISTAQAIVFGDTTPANDLMIKLLPSATINLQSGFLNYANAN